MFGRVKFYDAKRGYGFIEKTGELNRENTGKMMGQVKSFSKQRGYGFISSDNKDYFFRWTDIVTANHQHCKQGDRVSFTPQESTRGLRAVGVQAV